MSTVDTVPYPWPFDGVLTASRLALVVTGAQRWWAERCQGVDGAVTNLDRLARAVRARGALVVHVAHAAPVGSVRSGYLPRGRDADLVLDPGPGDVVVGAAGLSAVYGGALDPTLRSVGADRVLLAGLSLEGPVHSTLRDLNDRGYECLLVADACGFDSPRTRAAAISSVTMSGGVFGAVGDTAAVMDTLGSLEVARATRAG